MSVRGIETDWSRYLGKWYEQARFPSWFEPATTTDSTAEYQLLEDGSIRVINRGFDLFGNLIVAEGKARIQPTALGTLNVSFFPPFSSKYVVIDHNGNDYDMSVVATPSRQYLWLLTRNPVLTPYQWSRFLAVAQRAGYNDLTKLQRTPTRKRISTRNAGLGSFPINNRRKRPFIPTPWVGNIERLTTRNQQFRQVLKTGRRLQLVLMTLKPGQSIGLEIHREVDQFFRIEKGVGRMDYGFSRHNLMSNRVRSSDAIFIPAGTWHNLTNVGRSNLHLYTLYAPPNHPHELTW
jgi:lipocalin/mannose-6-phosphate isomerase-like protein (cupin superfamily)